MNETAITPEIPSESTIPAALVDAISAAYRDSDSTLTRRVAVLRRALNAGFTVKAISQTMAHAASVNPEITAVTATIYGYAANAANVLDTIGASNKDAGEVAALLARTAKHVGVASFKALIKETLAPIGEATVAEKLDAVSAICTAALAEQRKDRKVSREPRPNMGSGDTDAADIPNTEDAHPAPGKPDAAETIAALRRATKYLQQGQPVDAIMASAIAEFVAAAAKAQRRQTVTA